MLRVSDLFDLSQTEHASLFAGCEYAWEALPRIPGYLAAHVQPAQQGRLLGPATIGEQVCIGEGTVIEGGAVIQGPAIIGRNCEIRHQAYVRPNVIIGDNCVLGHACEFKHCLLFNGCVVPHFSFVGDSILGYQAHLGAGVILSNVKLLQDPVTIEWEGRRYATGLTKFGALLGDHADIGCNAVLNPGSIIGRGSVVYAHTSWRGVLPPHTLAKLRQTLELVPRQPPAS